MTIPACLIPYLDDLESRLDAQEEDEVLRQWVEFTLKGSSTPLFHPVRSKPNPPRMDWPDVKINAALEDPNMMVLHQFGAVSALLEHAAGNLPAVRCNYGSSILPSIFGVEMYIMDDALDTLPTSRPLNDIDAVHRLLDRGMPDPSSGWGERVFNMGERFAEIAQKYPKIGRYVFIYHPDVQGPMDVCEVLWGSSLFYALYDAPDLVKAFLTLITESYIAFLRTWAEIIPFSDTYNCHWGMLHRGSIMLRDDSAMNLSRAMFDEFILPFDQYLLDAMGGGAIHFCGKGDHYIESMTRMTGLHAINLSQPHLNDMERIFNHTVDQGIRLIGLDHHFAESSIEMGRDLHHLVHTC